MGGPLSRLTKQIEEMTKQKMLFVDCVTVTILGLELGFQETETRKKKEGKNRIIK